MLQIQVHDASYTMSAALQSATAGLKSQNSQSSKSDSVSPAESHRSTAPAAAEPSRPRRRTGSRLGKML